jgi:hypothetical protein
MSYKFALAATLAIMATPTIAQNNNATLLELVSACSENTLCSNQQTSDGTLFKLRHAGRTQTLLCQYDGDCVTLLAKGQRIKIKDGLAQLRLH